MKKQIKSKFHQLVVDRFGYYEAKHIHQEIALPSHPITKAYNNPENTPHKILIAFCELLDMHPHELIQNYQLGASRISDIEKRYHKKQYTHLEKHKL